VTFVDALYSDLLGRGIRYFIPEMEWSETGPADTSRAELHSETHDDGTLSLEWMGTRYRAAHPGREFTDAEARIVKTVGAVLKSRYEMLFDPPLAAEKLQIYRGLSEDQYVSAFLGPSPDRVTEAIEVLRISSSTTYENRRIETGVLLFGAHSDPCHHLPARPEGALRYSNELTGIRSFHRLCDGLQTVALVDREGLLVEIVDVQEWAKPFAEYPLAAPAADRFLAHSRATLCGGHVCLVLTPNGEIKIFSEGAEAFRFLDGRWRITDSAAKFKVWEDALGDGKLAERLFRVAVNLAEERRGGLFVVLRDRADAKQLIMPGDLLETCGKSAEKQGKGRLHYLLRGAKALDLPAAVLETVARIDGAIVLDRASHVLTFGAILQASSVGIRAVEGGRTTAALAASRFGDVLKVSEDGLVAFYRDGECVWEM
jgi:DisA bacterial checkpoint controller nucleotide-binding